VRTTIVIGEDHPMIRRGLISLLRTTDDLHVVAEAATPDELRDAVREHDPDLVILPIRFGDRTTGLDLCRDLKSETRSLVLIYTVFTTPEDLGASLLAGADGLVDKFTHELDLLAHLRSVVGGHRVWVVSDRTSQQTGDTLRSAPGLTARECQVLELLLLRRTNLQIARQLHIEVNTVKTHVRSILRKTGRENRIALLGDH
jgi:DNA-binding NarL/FixJ family response regulator